MGCYQRFYFMAGAGCCWPTAASFGARSWQAAIFPARPEAVRPGADHEGDRGAHLVGRGLSNSEAAAELFLSRKAVAASFGATYRSTLIRASSL